MTALLVIGAGGFGRAVAEAAMLGGRFRVAGFVDDRFPDLAPIWDLPVLGRTDDLASLAGRADAFVVAIGQNAKRRALFEQALRAGLAPASVVHPQALVSPRARIGRGAMVMAGSILGTEAEVGDGALVNAGAVVDHQGRVGAFAHLGIGARLGGAAVLGDGAWLREGCTVAAGQQVEAGRIVAPAGGQPT